MTHAELQESLAVYRDLRGAYREEVDRHVAGCAECSTLLSTYRAMDRNLSDLRDPRPDNRLRQGFYAATGQSETPAPAKPARRPRVLALGAPLAALAALAGIVLVVVLASAWAVWQGRIPGLGSTAGRPLGGAIPTPRSAVAGSFVWQTDGAFGYRMLRPAGWEAIDDGTSRTYVPPATPQESNWLRLGVINLGARYGGAGQDDSEAVAQLAAFKQNPTPAGWSAAMVQLLEHEGGQLQLLRSLPDAQIYSMRLPDATSLLMLLGFKVDGGQPLGITLLAGGPYADVTAMQNQGVLDDFVTMVASAHSIPFDPGNIAPALPPAGPMPIRATPTPAPTWTPAPVLTGPASWSTPQPDPDGWTRYASPDTGLSFAYPAGWQLTAPEGKPAPGTGVLYQLVALSGVFPGGVKADLVYLSYEIRPEQSLSDWVAVYQRAGGNPPQTAATEAGVMAEPGGRTHDTLWQTVKDARGVTQSFFLRQGRLVILLQASTTGQYADGLAATLKGILATFEFAPRAATTLDELYGTNRQWPTLDDYLRSVQPVGTVSACDAVCQDATATARLGLRATEEAYNQRAAATPTPP